MALRLKRVQEKATASDGYRMLVDRLWPRGISKERARLNEWNKVLPPSADLRKAFHGGEMDFGNFAKTYRAELRSHREELDRVRELAADRTVTLVYAAADQDQNHAVVLRDVLLRK